MNRENAFSYEDGPQYETARVAILLHALGGKRSSVCLGEILGVDQKKLLTVLHALREGGILEKESGEDRWTCHALPDAAQDFLPQRDDTLGHILKNRDDAQDLSISAACHDLVNLLICKSRIRGAAACLELLIKRLGRWEDDNATPENTRQYIDLVLACQSCSFSLGLCMKEAQSLSGSALQAARQLGDRRMMAQISLVEGCLKNLSGEGVNTVKLLHNSVEAIKSLGDSDIEGQISHFLAFLHYVQGDFEKTYIAFDRARQFDQIVKCKYFDEMYPLFIAPAAIYLGLFPEAVGTTISCLNTARQKGDTYGTIWWHAVLGICFLQIGMLDAALEHIVQSMNYGVIEPAQKLYLWIWRALALYHAQNGRMLYSYKILSSCIEERKRLGLGRFSYTAPWVLELLYLYHVEGLPDLPGFPLAQELNLVLESGNRHLHGMAYRIKGQMLLAENKPAEAVGSLHASRDAFQLAGNEREYARTLHVLAQCYQQLGRQGEAAELRHESDEILAGYAVTCAEIWGDEGRSDCAWKGCVIAENVQKKMRICLEKLYNIRYASSFESMRRDILCTVQRYLGAECGLLAEFPAGGAPCFLQGVNISKGDFESSLSHFAREGIHADVASGKALLLSDAGRISLVLPLKTGERTLCCILSSTLLAGSFINLEEKQRARLIRELRDCYRLYERFDRLSLKEQTEESSCPPDLSAISFSERHYDNSRGMHIPLEQARHAAQSDASILILGETGVGKEVLANRIHEYSGRRGPFVPVHPACTPESLFESEFFGYEKGAFTGATRQKIGLFELANNGTFFIDEVGEIPLSFQAKLLRVLQTHKFMRVGGTRFITSHFRLVAATNRDLRKEVQKGNFREDLYYRLSVIPIIIPPLRDRPEDIPDLLNLFIDEFSVRYGCSFPPVTAEMVDMFKRYSWPGNIREMKNVVERAVILSKGGPLRFYIGNEQVQKPSEVPQESPESFFEELPTLQELCQKYIAYVVKKTQGRITGKKSAQEILGISKSSLYAKIKELGLKNGS